MDLSLGKLQQLVAVAETGSFSRAASQLNTSQPALSRSIAAIEERYGFQIFNRMGHGVQLTAAGVQVIEQARPLLQSLRVFDDNLKLFGSGRTGTLAIGLAPLLASQILAEFASEFVGSVSEAQLKVMIRPGSELVDKLKNDLLELFFFPEGYIESSPDIDIKPVGSFMPVCVVRGDHPLALRDSLTLDNLAHYPWASSAGPPITEEAFNPVRFTCDNYHILKDAVLTSDLICICSRAFIEQELTDGSLKEIEVEGLPLPETTIYIAKLKGRVISPLAEDAIRRVQCLLTRDQGAPF